MEVKYNYVFQSDSEAVNMVYENNSNCLITYDDSVPKEYCILYFSSNNIYYPNSESTFNQEIVQKNRFEWFGSRIKLGYKHIFLRDIKKQWYLSGINKDLNSPEKLFEFLKKETEGFKVIALGSSAGGFASVIYGQLLNAVHIYTFNGQFEILSLLNTSEESIDPLLFRNRNNSELLPYYDTKPFIKHPESIYYFHSSKSQWDVEQRAYVNDLNINTISFNTSHHGIPFLKSNLPYILNVEEEKLKALKELNLNPILFSFKSVGFRKTIHELRVIAGTLLKKISNKFITP